MTAKTTKNNEAYSNINIPTSGLVSFLEDLSVNIIYRDKYLSLKNKENMAFPNSCLSVKARHIIRITEMLHKQGITRREARNLATVELNKIYNAVMNIL